MSRNLPEGWQSGKFGAFITLQRGFDLPVQHRKPGTFHVVASNGRIDTHMEPKVAGPAVVTGRSGTLGKVFYLADGCWPLNTTLYVKDFHGNDPKFVAWFLTHFQLERFGTGTGVPTLNRNVVHDVDVIFPPLHEQRRIAEILSSVDDAIAATRAVIEQTRKVKQGVLERLLTKGIGHTRFKQTEIGEIPEGWEVVRVEDIAASIDSGWSPDCEKVPAREGEWGILKTSAVVWEGYQPYENKSLPSYLKERPELQVKAGDVLVTRAGPVERTGVVALVRSTPQKLMLSDKIIRIRSKTHLCAPGFLALWLSSSRAQSEIIRKKSGMAQSQTNISQKALRELYIPLPPLEEQEHIVTTVQTLEESFHAQDTELRALIENKSALMSDLLTGRKRVTDALPMAAE